MRNAVTQATNMGSSTPSGVTNEDCQLAQTNGSEDATVKTVRKPSSAYRDSESPFESASSFLFARSTEIDLSELATKISSMIDSAKSKDDAEAHNLISEESDPIVSSAVEELFDRALALVNTNMTHD